MKRLGKVEEGRQILEQGQRDAQEAERAGQEWGAELALRYEKALVLFAEEYEAPPQE